VRGAPIGSRLPYTRLTLGPCHLFTKREGKATLAKGLIYIRGTAGLR